ncbi:unnamed protein product [Dicrocoelium dendriticum]|nr:unnamed protein product [Dicrocoelium dendriticum]
MAAVSFQCMSLIVLFRPMEMHLRINQVKRARQTAQESVRRAAAARRAATERLALEARHFKRMVIAKASAERAMALQLQQQQLLAVKKSANAMMAEGQSDSEMKRSDAKLQANTSFALGTRGRPNMVLMRTAQGGRVFTVQNPSRAPPPEPARPNPNTGGWLRNRTHSGRVGQTKRTPSRRIATYRGSIMQRIIEEKRRQRTISVGSLDGMVITRDNELIEASLAANCDRPLISSSAIQRISEAVARKIEMKLLQQQSTAIDGAGTTPSTATPGALGNHTFSRSHLRVSLPHVVQEYIQSQLSLTFQQQQQHRQSLCQIGDVQVASTFSPPASLVSPTSQTRPIPNPDLVSIQRDSTVIPNTTGVASIVLCTGDTAPVFGQSTPVNTAFSRSFWDAAQMGPISDPQPSQAITNLRSGNANPSSCPSESVSLRRNTSNVSLESRLHGGGASILTGGTSVAGPYDGAELLDNEIKAEINARLRRELARPQYKKDLFFTGSVAQLESSLVPSGLPSSPGLGRVIAIGPDKRSICATTAPLGHSNAAFKSSCLRASMQLVQQLNEHGGQDVRLSVPYLLLPDLLAELNWPLTDSGFAISAIAVGNTVGRLIVTLYIDKGWSSSYRWADCLWLNNISLLITSIAVALMPVSRIYYSALVLVCVLFGFFSAVFVSLKSILVVELLGLDRLTNSFGYMLLMQGIAAAVGTPFAGYLRELQLSKHLPHDMLAVHVCPVHHATSMGFYFAAGCLFLACLLSCPLRRLSLKECRTIVLEAHHPYAANPMFEFGPGHTALDAHIPSQTGDTELHPGLPEPNGIANCVTNFSDAFTKNAGDFPHEQAGVAFTSNQNSENQPGIALQPAQVAASQAASVSGSPGSACPGLLDVGSPCMLATIDENLPVVGGNVGTLDTVDLGIPSAVSPNAENLSVFDGLATSMLGVGALVLPASGVAASAACTVPTAMNPQLKKVEVMTVQEEPGLEPVAEEEEEYEEEEEPAPDIGEEVEGGSSAGPSDTGAHTDSTGLSIVSPSSDHPENSASEEQVPAKKWKRRKRKVGHLAHHPTSEIRLPLTESGDPETGLPATSEKIDIEGPNTD